MLLNKKIGLFLVLVFSLSIKSFSQKSLSDKFLALTNTNKWEEVSAVPLKFDAHHTQGLVKIGEYFYMTSVEVSQWPKKFDNPSGKYDRDTGRGVGHVMKFDANGNLLADVMIGEADMYHPGGIDFDGEYIWIPVTEYRPNSHSTIYRLDPKTMKATEVLRYPESIGAIIHNKDQHALVGANWNARKFYVWTLDAKGNVTNGQVKPEVLGIENPSFYVAFQDCKYLGNNLMLGSGHDSYKNNGGESFKLGGWEVFDLNDYRPRRQVPVKLWSKTGASMLNNPCAVESSDQGIRAYFVPDDDEKAVLYTYDIEVK